MLHFTGLVAQYISTVTELGWDTFLLDFKH